MHAVMITFESDIGPDELTAPFATYAEALQGVGGLIAKVWIHEGMTLGGFHLFVDRAQAEAYLESTLFAGVAANPGFRDFQIGHFGVIDELSARTGIPVLSTSAVPA